MRKYKIFIVVFIVNICATYSLSAHVYSFGMPTEGYYLGDQQERSTSVIEILINESTKVQMEVTESSNYLDIYSILGVRVKRVNLKENVGTCYVDLPKGLYILKINNTAQKIVVR